MSIQNSLNRALWSMAAVSSISAKAGNRDNKTSTPKAGNGGSSNQKERALPNNTQTSLGKLNDLHPSLQRRIQEAWGSQAAPTGPSDSSRRAAAQMAAASNQIEGAQDKISNQKNLKAQLELVDKLRESEIISGSQAKKITHKLRRANDGQQE